MDHVSMDPTVTDQSGGPRNIRIIGDQSSFCTRCRPLCLDPFQYLWKERVNSTDGTVLELIPKLVQSPYERYQHIPFILHDSLPVLQKLQDAASSGCKFCQLLRETILLNLSNIMPKGSDSSHTRTDSVYTQSDLHFDKAQYECIDARSRYDPEGVESWFLKSLSLFGTYVNMQGNIKSRKFNICFDILSLPETNTGPSLAIYQRPLDTNVLCPSNITMILSWINNCVESSHVNNVNRHELCKEVSQAVVAKRLVEIDMVDGSCRLVPGEEVHARYVALSYVRGEGQPPLRLTVNALDIFLKRIPFSLMPTGFQDVVRLVQALGLRHVWIDSLCIVQDDSDDWTSEVAKMKDIYGNAFLTIALSASSMSHDKIRADLEERIGVAMSWSSPVNVFRTGQFLLSPSVGVSSFHGASLQFFHDVGSSHWNTRGWTMQETLLSRRVLFFGARKMYFTCQNSLLMEGSDVFFEPSVLHHPALSVHWNWYRANFFRNRQSLFGNWMRIAQDYSKRNLYKANDKLPALAGIARHMKSMLGSKEDRYLAGVWSTDLINGLAWYFASEAPVNPNRLVSRPLIARAVLPSDFLGPSWAWTSHSSAVRFVSTDELQAQTNKEDKLTLVAADIQSHGQDPFAGQFSRSALVVTSQLIPLFLTYTVPLPNNITVFAPDDAFELSFSWTTSDFDNALQGRLETHALALQFLHMPRPFSKPYITLALIVTPAGCRSPDRTGLQQYRRIGLAFLMNERKESPFDGVEKSTLILV